MRDIIFDDTSGGNARVDPAEFLLDLGKGLAHRFFRGNVAAETESLDLAGFGLAVLDKPVGELFGGVLGVFFAQVDQDDGGCATGKSVMMSIELQCNPAGHVVRSCTSWAREVDERGWCKVPGRI